MTRTPPRHGPPHTAVNVRCCRTGCAPVEDSQLAAEIKGPRRPGRARRRAGPAWDLVARQQRRAVRIAYQYLRDAHDADEAVQDAFVKVFTHITSYREDLPFEVWFTRILVNACLDLRKSRSRRLRWSVPMTSTKRNRTDRPGDAGTDARAAAGLAGTRERNYDGRRIAPRSPAHGVHAVPPGGADDGRGSAQALGVERGDRSSPFVPRHPQAAAAAGAHSNDTASLVGRPSHRMSVSSSAALSRRAAAPGRVCPLRRAACTPARAARRCV